ncbi:MAG: chromosome partitioning protein [Treponemataceae bacterium]|nr:chromosome partitioning protein [Treponemataceae bacterium]
MEQQPENLRGMSLEEARAYILGHLSTLKLTEKQKEQLRQEREKWDKRVILAESLGQEDLAEQARKTRDELLHQETQLQAEIDSLKTSIQQMQHQLSALKAQERSIDTDILEQELLMATGHLPGEEREAATERSIATLEKEQTAQAALEELKKKMQNPPNPS